MPDAFAVGVKLVGLPPEARDRLFPRAERADAQVLANVIEVNWGIGMKGASPADMAKRLEDGEDWMASVLRLRGAGLIARNGRDGYIATDEGLARWKSFCDALRSTPRNRWCAE